MNSRKFAIGLLISLVVALVISLLVVSERAEAATPYYPLTLSVSGPAFGVKPGSIINIRLTVRNTGNGQYYKTAVAVYGFKQWLGVLPKNVANNDGILHWTIVSLGKYQSKSIVLKLRAPDGSFGVSAEMWTPTIPNVRISDNYVYTD